MVIIIREFLLVYVFISSVYSAPTSQTEDVDQVCSSTCSLEISNNKRKKVDTTATDVINSMAVYLRTLSVQITEDKIAVPERPRITLTTEESQLEEIIKKGRDFKAYPEKFGPIKLGTRDRYVKREILEDEEWIYLSTNEVAGNTMKCVWCSLAHLISSNKYKDWSWPSVKFN